MQAGIRATKSSLIFTALIILAMLIVAMIPHPRSAQAATAPQWTESFFLRTIDPTKLYNLGEEMGNLSTDQGPGNGVVILDFGSPKWDPVGGYGTMLYDHSFANQSQIVQAAYSFAQGFWFGTPLNGPLVRIVVGTSNLYMWYDSNNNIVTDPVDFYHGQFWADTVNQAANQIRGAGFSSQITVSGGNDIELNWGTQPTTNEWIRGWQSLAQHVYYDFGDAAGCYVPGPTLCTQPSSPNPPTPQWTIDDVWYKSYGATAAYPIPEIYLCCQGARWAHLSHDANTRHGHIIVFAGELTDRCFYFETNCPPMTNGNPNVHTPDVGWNELYNALNNNYPDTHQALGWSSDIRWYTLP